MTLKQMRIVFFVACAFLLAPSYAEEPCATVSSTQLAQLQSEISDLRKRLDTLEEFDAMSTHQIQECLSVSTSIEPLVLTFVELSRHAHKELAAKAQDIRDRFDFSLYVGQELNSGDRTRQENVIYRFLFRLKPEAAKKALESVEFPSNINKEDVIMELDQGASLVLIPSESVHGDRYYVYAQWDAVQEDAAQEEVAQCLTEVFHKELASGRTVEEEKALMDQLKGKRWIYWYSKNWALHVHYRIQQCGGQAQFVSQP